MPSSLDGALKGVRYWYATSINTLRHSLPIRSFHCDALRSFPRVILKLDVIATNKRDLDKVPVVSLAVYDNHGLFRCGLELKVDVTRESHVKGWQFDNGVVSPKKKRKKICENHKSRIEHCDLTGKK